MKAPDKSVDLIAWDVGNLESFHRLAKFFFTRHINKPSVACFAANLGTSNTPQELSATRRAPGSFGAEVFKHYSTIPFFHTRRSLSAFGKHAN
jgi:hypothetical protein